MVGAVLLAIGLLGGWDSHTTIETVASQVSGLRSQVSHLAVRDSVIVIYIVRHAEKLDDSRDPPLNDKGKRRADRLVDELRDAGITHIWSSIFQRARATAEPLAERLNLEVRQYDPTNHEGFAQVLLSTPGRHLVVGHSNTAPALVQALGGDPHGNIRDSEYDRLYVVVASPGRVTTMVLRYGESSRP